MRTTIVVASALLSFAAVGCWWPHPAVGALATDGVRFVAPGGETSSISSGQLFEVRDRNIMSVNTCYGTGDMTYERAHGDAPSAFAYAEVLHPALPEGEHLYAAYVFCEVPTQPDVPLTYQEFYLLQIPSEYVEETSDGSGRF